MFRLISVALFLVLCTKAVYGTVSIVASDLEWQTISGANGLYKIRLTLYVDATSGYVGQTAPEEKIYLFRNDEHWKNNGQWLDFVSFNVNKVSSERLEQDTVGCSGKGSWDDFEGQRHVFLNVYEATIPVPELSQFDDNTGFIIAWYANGTRTAGEGSDRNFREPSPRAWLTTYIPPLKANGDVMRNSTPVIGRINTFFICKDQLATIPLVATDGDGDHLKYRLSKPDGMETYNPRNGGQSGLFTYDFVWATGYSEQNQIHGEPALTINENSGVMTVKPNEKGQYFVGIVVEEYRNGQRIGYVNFHYTLVVVDCNEQQVFDKKLYKDTSAVTTLTLCEGSSATLTSKQSFPDPQPEFQWTKNGKVIWGANTQSITIHEEGNYQLLTKNIDGCPDSFDSEIVHVSITSASGAEMDSIPPICDVATSPILMYASPAGGTFAGPGVSENTFDPGIAGVGRHEVEYAIQGTDACPGSVTRRQVVVGETPVLDLIDVLFASRGKPISIGTTDSLNVTYQWSPPTYLNNATYANPTSTPLANFTYTATATNAYGCSATHEVKVRIIENVLIPDAFTPNNDGINEKWELKGIAEYPNCRVTIYNRWGTVIFHSVGYQTAFDGTAGGALQMPGVYAYRIRLTENSPEMTGSLTLIR